MDHQHPQPVILWSASVRVVSRKIKMSITRGNPPKQFTDALRALLKQNFKEFTAADLAHQLWPKARTNNAHGQYHNMAAGVAGQMLRRYRGAHEVRPRVWSVVPEFLPDEPT